LKGKGYIEFLNHDKRVVLNLVVRTFVSTVFKLHVLKSGDVLVSQVTVSLPLSQILLLVTVDPAMPGGYDWVTLFLGDIHTGTWPSTFLKSQY
jgi:hypothetical protein